MKHLSILLVIILFFARARAQDFSKTIPICNGIFTYSATIQPDKSVKITIQNVNSAANKVEYPYSGNSVDDFRTIFKMQFQRIASTCTLAEVIGLENEASSFWNTIRRLSMAALPQSYSKTIAIGNGSYTYTGTFDTDNSMKITIVDVADANKKVEYNFSGSDVTMFMAVFQRNFLRINGFSGSDSERDILLKEGNSLWLQMTAIRPLLEPLDAPESGKLYIAGKLRYNISFVNKDKNGKEETFHSKDYSVQDVHIEFNNGYMENIVVVLLVKGKPRTYVNIYGIGFTSIENQNKLKSIRLYERGAKAFRDKKPMTLDEAMRSGEDRTYIVLGDLLQYKNKLEVDRRDYSPKDMVINTYGGQDIQLYKEQTNKLFEAHIYSDFIGLQEDKPNGLIQTEVEKRININTAQWQTCRFWFPIVKSFGIFQYIKPTITLSKLEQHNKHYVLGDLDSIRYHPGENDTASLNKNAHRYATPLELYQHQSFSAGCDLNVLFFANHNLKFNVYLDIGGRLGITPVIDSFTIVGPEKITKTGVTREYTINTLQIVPQVKLVFLPEERFNFALSYSAIYITPFASGVELLGFGKDDPQKFTLQRNKWLNTMELLMSFNVNKSGEGKLFGRARFNAEVANYNSNFAQIQVGYSTYILGKNK